MGLSQDKTSHGYTPLPDPLEVVAAGPCAICGQEQLATVEIRTETAGGIRIEVVRYLECGCGRRRVDGGS